MKDQKIEQSERMEGIDAFRYIAFLFVVLLHCISLQQYEVEPRGVLDHVARFAVPYFFIASGFFLGRKNEDALATIMRIAKRLMPAFLLWVCVYTVLAGHAAELIDPAYIARALWAGGYGYHLWFLPALGVSAAGVILLQRFGMGLMAAVAAILYIAGLVLGPYASFLGIEKIFIDTRNGPFFGFSFVLIGYFLARRNSYSFKAGIVMAAIGFLLQMSEAFLLSTTGNGAFIPYDFLIGTALFGSGVFICSQHIPNRAWTKPLAKLSQASFVMYCLHLAVVWQLNEFIVKGDLTMDLVKACMVAGITTPLALALLKIPYLKKIIS